MTSAPGKVCPSCGNGYEADVLYCPKDGTPLATRDPHAGSDPYVGVEILGQIRLEQLIGIGSMGRVYRAHQAGIERDVAVKILHRELSSNPQLVTRFLREAKVASRLVHPNVVQVLMTGQLAATTPAADGAMYLVMEYLDGLSLHSALAAAGGALPLPRALHVVLQVCDAVGEAHAQQIVHRDLKPENVMLVRRGDDPEYVKVLDFGIARLSSWDSPQATQAGAIFGTARYISPEGAAGEPVGPAADVYAIATVLYQALSGRTPFEGDSPVALLVRHTQEAPPELRSIQRASYVPEPLARAIMRNLAKRPDERDPDARAFGRTLVEAARASGLSPDELVPRSTLLGSRARAVSLSSIERTKPLELSPALAARIGAFSPRTHATGTEPGAVDPSLVDRTIVDEPPAAPAPMPSPPSWPSPALESLPTSLPRRSSVPPPASRPSYPQPLVHSPSYAPPRSAGPTPITSESTLDDDDTPPRSRVPAVVFVAACFVGGAALAVFAAYRSGLVHPRPASAAATQPAPTAPPIAVTEVALPPIDATTSAPAPTAKPDPPPHAKDSPKPAHPAVAKPAPSASPPSVPDAGLAPLPSASSGGRWL